MTADDEAWPPVATALAEGWAFPVTSHHRLTGGRNAKTWRVTGPAGAAVAKLVEPGDANLDHFEASLQTAALLDRPDLPTAAPLSSRDGRPVVALGDGRLALLPWIGGAALDGTVESDLDRIGRVLANLHRRAAELPTPRVPMWPWEWLDLAALDLRPLDPDDAGLVERAARVPKDPRPLGLLHGDPTPDSFLADGPVVAVIDWASVMQGPLRYDLAVLVLAVERAGARPDQVDRLISGYEAALAAGTGDPISAKPTADLAQMRAVRLAAEIVYFTSRLRRPPRAQLDAREDLAGLARAREALRLLV